MIDAVVILDFGEFLFGVVEVFGEFLERLALRRDLRGRQRSVFYRVVGGFLLHAIGLRVGVFVVQLQQARGEDVGFFLGIDDVELALEAGPALRSIFPSCAFSSSSWRSMNSLKPAVAL